ncbi:MotE family protein [Antarcticirhabdus aurantiaca]|uniref:MotE family protein n=1 Tax=Antarcticirhabdus aurantiaca TaxID=2606717 RepID=A0ACD4NTZ1_9HYPH|nr:MotE family protein [Antarcticirhabdus aurantiaca]WAJ30208.1 MotE family protein [Jeongeuplla avenae]
MRTIALLRSSALAAVACLVLLPAAAQAEGAAPAAPAAPPEIPPQEVRLVGPDGEPLPPAPQTEVERYCTSIADQARDARYAAQANELKAMESQVGVKLDELEAKRAEYQKWLEERRAFLDSADTILLDIYAQMKPDAAATQMAGIDRSVAAALLSKLKSRQASAILAEMKPEAAAEIAGLIAQKTADPEAAARAEKAASAEPVPVTRAGGSAT